jgi:hypothetical protein
VRDVAGEISGHVVASWRGVVDVMSLVYGDGWEDTLDEDCKVGLLGGMVVFRFPVDRLDFVWIGSGNVAEVEWGYDDDATCTVWAGNGEPLRAETVENVAGLTPP